MMAIALVAVGLASAGVPSELREVARTDEPELRGRTLSLAECIEIARQRSPRARRSWQAARAASARVGEQRAAYFPSPDFAAGAARSDTVDLRDKGTSPLRDRTAGLSVSYLLFDGGRRGARVRGARAEGRAADFEHDAALLDVALAVELAYAERLAATALLGVGEVTVRQSQTHVDVARARHQAGVVPRLDVLKAETEKADADLSLVRARGAVRVAQAALSQAMGLRVSETFEIEDFPEMPPAQALAEVEGFLEEAKGRPELQAAAATVEARRADVRVTDADWFPLVTGGADYGWRDKQALPAGSEWGLRIGVTLPVFDGLARVYRKRAAGAELARAAADRDDLLQGVELEVWTEHSRVTEATEAEEAARKFVASAEESARVAEGMYRAGAGSILEMVDSLAALTAARIRLVQASLDLHSAGARLNRAVGRTRPASP